MAGFLHQVVEKFSGHDALHIVLFFALLSVVHQLGRAIYNLYFHPLSHIPGPPLWIAFPITRTISMVRGTGEYSIRDAHEKYGEVIRITASQVSFINPQAWKDIYGHGHAEFPKFYPKGIHMDPKRITSSNAQDHFRYRRAMLPAFSDKALLQQEPLMKVYVDLLVEKLHEVAKTGKPTDMVKWYNFTTFDLIADLAYGTPLEGLAKGKSNAWLDNISNLMKYMPIMVLIGVSPIIGYIFKLVAGSKLRDSQTNHNALVAKLANDRIHRRKQADRGDFMDYIMRSRGQAHELTDQELIINSDLLMVAGSETTATLLSGATYWMLRTPEALKKATEEVRNAFQSEDAMSFNELRSRLPYMMACLEEGLRLFPPVPLLLARAVPSGPPMQVAGLSIPEKVRATTFLLWQ